MKKKPYLPTKESKKVTWLNNFAAKIGGYVTTFGISVAEVTITITMALIYVYHVLTLGIKNSIFMSGVFKKSVNRSLFYSTN